MKQVIQNYKTGKISLMEVPMPALKSNFLLVKNINSVVSIGTERQMIELGRKSLLGKAKARPDLVKRFLAKAKKEGLLKTFHEAMGRLEDPVLLGYSSAGIVIAAGKNVNSFSPGDKVACIGAGFASHAEYVSVPENLCVKMPEIQFEEAAFGMLGIIALHGIRTADLRFGERVGVIGLGLLGLITVQILKAYGCYVIATDIDPDKIEQAKKLGADISVGGADFVEECNRSSKGSGADAVIITAATKSDEPVNQAVDAARFKGKVVLIGVADIHPNRNEMWKKEVQVIVSQAGGPGTFDPLYELQGLDYPPEHVRWTQNRNLEEFLRLIKEKKVDVKALMTHTFSIEDAEKVYENIMENKGGPYIGVLFSYPKDTSPKMTIDIKPAPVKVKQGSLNLGVIGAGLFGKALLLPALRKRKDVALITLSTSTGANSRMTGDKYGFNKCTTDYNEVLKDEAIDSVIIITPHSAHAEMVNRSLQAGKNVFVEKPLCVNEDELKGIIETFESLKSRPTLFVGYNRRFSPLSSSMKEFFKHRLDPLVMTYRVNPGFIKGDHWVHSPEQGGSRIIGEMCHFVDMMQFISGSMIVKANAERISGNNKTALNSDNVVITLKFADGSVGALIYAASGDKAFSREHFEVFGEGRVAALEDYRTLDLHHDGKKKTIRLSNQDMGYDAEIDNFIGAVQGAAQALISPAEIFNSTLTVFKINEALEQGKEIKINETPAVN
jgi:predicted dehydrogenase/threonine dehydrogenase-like Zn-dependent dehydrogenase